MLIRVSRATASKEGSTARKLPNPDKAVRCISYTKPSVFPQPSASAPASGALSFGKGSRAALEGARGSIEGALREH